MAAAAVAVAAATIIARVLRHVNAVGIEGLGLLGPAKEPLMNLASLQGPMDHCCSAGASLTVWREGHRLTGCGW